VLAASATAHPYTLAAALAALEALREEERAPPPGKLVTDESTEKVAPHAGADTTGTDDAGCVFVRALAGHFASA
jgi:hypothetical protein